MNPNTLTRPATRTEPPSDTSWQRPEAETERTNALVEQAKQNVGEQVRHVVEDLKEGGAETLQAAKDAGSGFVQSQQEKFATRIDEYTEAVKAACASLQNDEANPLAGPAKTASRQLERAADYLRQKDPVEILDDLGTLARKNPEVVYGVMFVAGLAAVRFLKATSKTRGKVNVHSSSWQDDDKNLQNPPQGPGFQAKPAEWSPAPSPADTVIAVNPLNSPPNS